MKNKKMIFGIHRPSKMIHEASVAEVRKKKELRDRAGHMEVCTREEHEKKHKGL